MRDTPSTKGRLAKCNPSFHLLGNLETLNQKGCRFRETEHNRKSGVGLKLGNQMKLWHLQYLPPYHPIWPQILSKEFFSGRNSEKTYRF